MPRLVAPESAIESAKVVSLSAKSFAPQKSTIETT